MSNRIALWWLAVATIAGTLIELAMLRHWDSPSQLVPWVALLAMTWALAMLRWGTPRFVLVAKVVLVVGLATGVLGLVQHVLANLAEAPLDGVLGASWDTRNPLARWWLAATGGVGVSPPMAPLLVSQVGVLALLAGRGGGLGDDD